MAVCIIMYFMPLGAIFYDTSINFNVCGFFNAEDKSIVQFNWLLSSVLSITLLLQFIALFMFKNRIRQAMLVQVTLISLLLFVVLALVYQDIFSLKVAGKTVEQKINYNWNILLIVVSWILTYLALRGIKKEETLIQSTNRMR
jgi:hypothetical protein